MAGALTYFDTTNPLTVKLWSDRLYYDLNTDDDLLGMAVADGIVKREDDLQKSAGDRIRVPFLNRIKAAGIGEGQTIYTNSQALTYEYDDVIIGERRQTVQIPQKGFIGQQRVKLDLMEDSYITLRNWANERRTVSFFNQISGFDATTFTYDGISYTPSTYKELTGEQAVPAVATSRFFRPNSLATDALVNADPTATAKLSHVRDLENIAKTDRTLSYIEKIGKEYDYVWYVHTDVFDQLISDTSAPMQYREMFYSMITAGKNNGTIDRSFLYSRTKIIETDKLPNGVNSGTVQTNTRRGSFCGKNAAAMSHGMGYNSVADGKEVKGQAGFRFDTEEYDAKSKLFIAVTMLWGLKRTLFNGVDRGVIATTHYVA